MPSIPKPQPCGQNWLAMSPTEKGRLCGQCAKEIHDFSAFSWSEIERRQRAHGNVLCGMYSPAQLTYWGQDPPTAQGACARLAAATTLALSLSAISAPAQTTVTSQRPALVLRGIVQGISAGGKPEPAPGVTVLLAGTQVGVPTDEQGHYELIIPDSIDVRSHATIVFSYVGYVTKALSLNFLNTNRTGLVTYDAQLVLNTDIIGFSVAMPTRMQRAKWALKRWFGRSE